MAHEQRAQPLATNAEIEALVGEPVTAAAIIYVDTNGVIHTWWAGESDWAKLLAGAAELQHRLLHIDWDNRPGDAQ